MSEDGNFIAVNRRPLIQSMPLLRSFARIRNRHFLLIDALFLLVTPTLALVIRLETVDFPTKIRPGLFVFTFTGLIVYLVTFYLFGLYRRYWQYASIDDLIQIALAAATGTAILTGLLFAILWLTTITFARSVLIINGILILLLSGGVRFLARYSHSRRHLASAKGQRVIVFGAGDAGAMIAREMQSKPQLGYRPVAFLDDDPQKHHIRLLGLPVLGGRESLNEVIRSLRPKYIIIAMPTAPGEIIQEIRTVCDLLQVETKIVPDMSEIIGDRLQVTQLRDVDIQDLLRREPVQTDIDAIQNALTGLRVMVTGGGGSIGGELCRQILFCRPKELIILGHGENSIFEICATLRLFGLQDVKITPVIADVRFAGRIDRIFTRYRPQILFHAAAHKHVPLMELDPAEAITNNVLGTKIVVEAAGRHGVARFVLISTDKAVNPSSIMGASKRVAELFVCDAAQRFGRPYVSVRFGNVLGSRGSVVLTFKKQIAAGGPVTVTDKRVKRYFMTIPEAVQLVLQAAVIGRRGEVLVLDMGEPVAIDDLARRMIRLSGLEPDQDIDVQYIGLRPGEKLFEELFTTAEHHHPTRHQKILTAKNGANTESANLIAGVDQLIDAALSGNQAAITAHIQFLVPQYKIPVSETALLERVDSSE
jgi:FlaA1/EpsC-like NDP-sugar epimerase